MKPREATRSIDANIKGEVVAMDFAVGAGVHLQGVLAGLYEDREMALIREYTTNARDSHIEAGTTRPVEVSTPTALRLILSIRDYGVGMDAEDIRKTYSQFGASTKRESDDVTGMLGLGSKSALAYTDQFTVVGIKDGRRTVVSVTMTNAGGQMTILPGSGDPTDEPNGVEVQIPAQHENEFAEKAAELFRFWPEGSVLVNGKPPKRIRGTQVGERFLIVDDGTLYNDTLVMGGVPYDMTEFIGNARAKLSGDSGPRYRPRYRAHRIVAFVDMGAVDFVPSREGLKDTRRTTEAIEEIWQSFSAGLLSALQARLDGAASRHEAFLLRARLQSEAHSFGVRVSSSQLTYRGQPVPAVLHVPDDGTVDVRKKGVLAAAQHTPGARYHEFGPNVLEHVGCWLVNFPNEKFTKPQRDKLAGFLNEIGQPVTTREHRILLARTPTIPPEVAKWHTPPMVLDWQVVRKWKDPNAPKQTRNGRKVTGTYDIIQLDKGAPAVGTTVPATVPATEIPDDPMTVYYDQSTGGAALIKAQTLGPFLDKVLLVVLPANRVAKFERTYPKARRWSEVLLEVVEAKLKALDADGRDAIHQPTESDWLHMLAPERVPEKWKRAVRVAKRRHDQDIQDIRRAKASVSGVAHLDSWPRPGNVPDENALIDHAPLLADLCDYEIDDDYAPQRHYGAAKVTPKKRREHIYLYLHAINKKETNK